MDDLQMLLGLAASADDGKELKKVTGRLMNDGSGKNVVK